MHILDIVDVDNMVSELDTETLNRIGADVVKEYDIDKDSMDDWLSRNEMALKLANLAPEAKADPWPGAANTKLPLVLNAAMKASAEEYAEILRGKKLVKGEILGKQTKEKEDRAERVTTRMNHQFFHELEDWAEDHDKLIMAKNLVGTVHKKLLYEDGKIQCVLRRNGVVINDSVEKTKDAPRITDELEKYWWQAEEKFRADEWEEIILSDDAADDQAEKDKLNLFLEQIRREDLDDDGYPEPYIVTVHKNTKQVVRITPNYTPESIIFDKDIDVLEYQDLSDSDKATVKGQLTVKRIDTSYSRIKYIKYDMIPAWEGGYWGVGFGFLLGPLNENCNTLINHLLNAGHLAVKGGGFINSGVKMAGGELRFRANEWKKVQSPGMDLSRNIVPLPVKEPSQTLFSLLGLLMDVLRELSSVTEVMSGEQPKANMAASSVLALIEQGKKMFNSVYKRHYRSLTKEQNAVFDLNFIYQDPTAYAELLDMDPQEGMELVRADFTRKGMDVQPTANPEFSSKLQRITEAQATLEMKDDPRVNGTMVIRRYFEAVYDDSDVANELVPEEPNMTPDQVSQQMEQAKQEMLDTNEMRESEANAKTAEINLEIKKLEVQYLTVKGDLETVQRRIDTEKKQATGQIEISTGMLKNEKARIDVDKASAQ